jgi:hypothetical protein
MISSKNPTAAQKRYRQMIANAGCIITGEPDVHIDHLWGSTTKNNKVHIGQYAIIALTPGLHMYNKINRTTTETEFYEFWDIPGGSLTECRIELYRMQKQLVPGVVPDDVDRAILSYRK